MLLALEHIFFIVLLSMNGRYMIATVTEQGDEHNIGIYHEHNKTVWGGCCWNNCFDKKNQMMKGKNNVGGKEKL